MQAFLANIFVAKQGLVRSTCYAEGLPIFQRHLTPQSLEEYMMSNIYDRAPSSKSIYRYTLLSSTINKSSPPHSFTKT